MKKNKNKLIILGKLGFLKMYLESIKKYGDHDFVVWEDDHLNIYTESDLKKLEKLS